MPIVSIKGLTPKQSALTNRELKHLLRRTTFGLSKELFSYFENKSFNTIIDELLTFWGEPSMPLKYYYSNIDNHIQLGETWVNEGWVPGIQEPRHISLVARTLMNQLEDISITEKMTYFIHSFIPVSDGAIDSPPLTYWYYNLLRKNCLGNFKKIIKDVTLNPAMMYYLNGLYNNKNNPDENYARELMELFTLGKEYSPIYNENDIKEAAKILTGYGIIGHSGSPQPWVHDFSDKKFSSFFNNKVIKGQSWYNQEKELDEMIDMIFLKEEVSIYFATRLYRFFVYYEIDATIENNIIKPLAKVFRDNNYEIKPVIKALITSEHFYDTNVMGSYIKSPMELYLGHIKEGSIKFPNSSDIYKQYTTVEKVLINNLKPIGQVMFLPDNVAGWSAYYQKPLYHENWITTNTTIERNKFLVNMVNGIIDQNVNFNVIENAKKTSNASDINAFIFEVLDWHLTIEPTADIKTHMKSILLYGQVEDHYWTDLWNSHIANPNNKQIKDQLESVLKEFYEFLFSLPEYQLM